MTNHHHDQSTLIDDVSHLPIEAHRRTDALEAQVDNAVNRHRESLLLRVLERDEYRVVRQQRAAELLQGFEHRRAALELAMQSRLDATREACNHVLVMGKVHLREQRIEHFTAVYQRLEARIQGLIDDFITEAEARYERSEKIRVEHLRERERQRQQKAASDFIDTLERLLDEFRRITDETIGGA